MNTKKWKTINIWDNLVLWAMVVGYAFMFLYIAWIFMVEICL